MLVRKRIWETWLPYYVQFRFGLMQFSAPTISRIRALDSLVGHEKRLRQAFLGQSLMILCLTALHSWKYN
jgi:hypothetical protein